MPRTLPAPLEPPPCARDGSLGRDRLVRDEWLLTNGLGGFAMGTALGMPTRRYHGLLIASLSPPVDRILALHSIVESVEINPGPPPERTAELAAFRFRGGTEHPRGWTHLSRFEDVGAGTCRWLYRAGEVEVLKSVHLHAGRNAVSVRYTVRPGRGLVRLSLRPLAALRGYHSLLSASAGGEFRVESATRTACIRRNAGRALSMTLRADAGWFQEDVQWWYGFEYAHELDRGYDGHEDLFSPGVFTFQARQGAEATFKLDAWVDDDEPADPGEDENNTRQRTADLTAAAARRTAPPDASLARLVAASDAFVTRRGDASATIVAGYPWFADWGRDALISLPGLLLTTGRLDQAKGVLQTLAVNMHNGLVPNLFSETRGQCRYNTVDAALWYLHAAREYVEAAGREAWSGPIMDACRRIIDAYRRGTDFGIRMDPADGLITAGDAATQLTWMDAETGGRPVTPRFGKAVEINALWHHGLLRIAELAQAGDAAWAAELRAVAARAGASFRAKFWNSATGGLHDVLEPSGGAWVPVPQIRPNQIFAASLACSPLTPEQRRSVVRLVRERLVTPLGVRTLDPADPQYRGRYRGPMPDRDRAYHSGTAWPWLLGPVGEAMLRAGDFSGAARAEVRALLAPIIARMDGEAIGQIPEVFDGDGTADDPQRPGGCPAQAWSVAEVLRVYALALAGS